MLIPGLLRGITHRRETDVNQSTLHEIKGKKIKFKETVCLQAISVHSTLRYELVA